MGNRCLVCGALAGRDPGQCHGHPVTLEIAGKERTLRFTMQAQKRICDIFGMDFKSAFAKYNLGAIPGILWAVMHDRRGNPPEDITLEEIGEMLTMEDVARCMGAIQSASEEGRVPKEQYEEDMNKTILAESQKASSGNGRFAHSGLVSPMSSSGTDTPSEKSSIELSNTELNSENSTLVSA